MSTDAELLAAFVDSRSEAAFATLVERHLPLVYSVAWRQVGDAHRAKDIAQTVFTLLARKAHTLRGHPSFVGWLHISTHYAAAKVLRTEQRRFRHEREALAIQNEAMSVSGSVEFERLRPVIDGALIELKEADRTAVLLRYFENQSYAAIGEQLGLSENTVRMRVDRALDRLRLGLSRRGIDSPAAAIGLALASQTTCAIPAGLAASVASAALTMSAGGALVLIMSATILKNSAMAAVVLAGASVLILQQRQIGRLEADNVRLVEAARAAANHALSLPPQTAVDPKPLGLETELARLRAQVEQLKGSPASSWQERVALLKEMLEQLPEQNIPELALASDEDWLDAAKHKLETTDDYRRALATVRNLSIAKFTQQLQPALRAYLAAHGGQFPANASELQGYMESKIDDAIWRRYVVTTADTVKNVGMGGSFIITQGSVVDPTFDSEFVVGPDGFGSSSYGVSSLVALEKAYRQANGKNADDPAQLLPYATTERQRAAVLARIEQRQTDQMANNR